MLNKVELDNRIRDFLDRKDAQYPSLGLRARDAGKTLRVDKTFVKSPYHFDNSKPITSS